MKFERNSIGFPPLWIGTILVLLLGGLLIGRTLAPVPDDEAPPLETPPFRAWFWERRTFDLLAQVGLIFAGALGVAAVLPQRQEHFEEDGQ